MQKIKKKHSQIVLYILLLAAVVAVMSSARRCSSGGKLPPVESGGSAGDTIDVAIIYGPLSYYLYNDTLGGVNLDILKEFERDARRPVKLWPVVNLHESLAKLKSGDFDMLASLPADNSVKQRFLTTESVFLDRLVLIQLADSLGNVKIKSALDLPGDTIHIQRDSPAAARLANLSNEIGENIPVVTDEKLSEEYLCMKVATGEIRLAVVNERLARSMKLKYPGLSYDNPVSFTQFQVWVLPKADTLMLREVNSWLSEFMKTPRYREIVGKY